METKSAGGIRVSAIHRCAMQFEGHQDWLRRGVAPNHTHVADNGAQSCLLSGCAGGKDKGRAHAGRQEESYLAHPRLNHHEDTRAKRRACSERQNKPYHTAVIATLETQLQTELHVAGIERPGGLSEISEGQVIIRSAARCCQ